MSDETIMNSASERSLRSENSCSSLPSDSGHTLLSESPAVNLDALDFYCNEPFFSLPVRNSQAAKVFVSYVASVLEAELVPDDLGAQALRNGLPNAGPSPPPIREYLARMVVLLKLDPSILIVALVLLCKIFAAHPLLRLTLANIYRLTLTACLVTAKVYQDQPFTNGYVARVSGSFSRDEINKMELEFLVLLQYRLAVDRNAYNWMQERAFQHYEQKHGKAIE